MPELLHRPLQHAFAGVRRARPGASSAARRPRGAVTELVLVLGGVLAYFGARGLSGSDPAAALDHAHDVVDFERSVGLFREPDLQRLVLPHEAVLDVLNWVYIWGHWPVIALVLLWTLRRHLEAYVVLRNALVISGALGLVVFVLYPVAPPRLADLGLVDSVTERSHAYRVLQPTAFVNQYAAVPSLHVGWDLLMGVTLVRYGRHGLLRLAGVLLPLTMAVAVVLTANHYLVDAILGAVVAVTGLLAAERLATRTAAGPLAAVPLQRGSPGP